MGEVIVSLKLENTTDRENVESGLIKAGALRTLETRAVADSGAAMLVLPQDQVEALGLRIVGKVIVEYADERKEERPLARGVTVYVDGRNANVDCIVGPPASEPLLGQVPLEIMDLLIDCPRNRLMPRPESPLLPLLKLR
ncbi:MAG: aspartyl protease family protein [Blastocatellia bacterium]